MNVVIWEGIRGNRNEFGCRNRPFCASQFIRLRDQPTNQLTDKWTRSLTDVLGRT